MATFGWLFCGVWGFCVKCKSTFTAFLSWYFQSGTCRLSSMGALLLTSRRDRCSWTFIVSHVWVSSRSSYMGWCHAGSLCCVCVTHDVCIMLGSFLVFLVFFVMWWWEERLSYLFYHNSLPPSILSWEWFQDKLQTYCCLWLVIYLKMTHHMTKHDSWHSRWRHLENDYWWIPPCSFMTHSLFSHDISYCLFS